MRTAVALVLFFLMALAFCLTQHSVLFRWTFLGAQPDLLALLALGVALRSGPAVGASAGFFCGALRGWAAGAGLTAAAASLALVGFAAGYLSRFEVKPTSLVIGALVAVGTLVARFLALLVAPPSDIPSYLTATIGSAIMNGVLAVPLDAVWKRLIGEAVD